MRHKKGIELSVNFLVMLIIALAVFIFGIYLATKIFGQATDISEMSQAEIDKRFEDLFCPGYQELCLSKTRLTIDIGKTELVGANVQNVLKEGDPSNLKILMELTKYIDKDNVPHTSDLPGPDKIAYRPDANTGVSFTLEPRENRRVGMAIQVNPGTPAGTYIFDVKVVKNTETNTQYGSTQKIYVTVP